MSSMAAQATASETRVLTPEDQKKIIRFLQNIPQGADITVRLAGENVHFNLPEDGSGRPALQEIVKTRRFGA